MVDRVDGVVRIKATERKSSLARTYSIRERDARVQRVPPARCASTPSSIGLAGEPPFTRPLGEDSEDALSFEELRRKVLEVAGRRVRLQRFKGLGEMNAEQLARDDDGPATRTLAQVTMDDAADGRHALHDADGRQGRAAAGVHRGERPRRLAWTSKELTVATSDVISGGNIEPRGLEEEMRSSYLDYAMSVIVGRALPDVRDGLKPVHRRVLYAMNELGLNPTRPYSKCAKIVGEVMGNYHPHGDSAIYDTLVRLAQDFSMRNVARRRPGQLRLRRRRPGCRDAVLRRRRYPRRARDGTRPDRRPRRRPRARRRARRRPLGPRPPRPPASRLEALPLRRPPDAARAHARGLRADRHREPPGPLPGRHRRRADADLEAARRDQGRRPRRPQPHARAASRPS